MPSDVARYATSHMLSCARRRGGSFVRTSPQSRQGPLRGVARSGGGKGGRAVAAFDTSPPPPLHFPYASPYRTGGGVRYTRVNGRENSRGEGLDGGPNAHFLDPYGVPSVLGLRLRVRPEGSARSMKHVQCNSRFMKHETRAMHVSCSMHSMTKTGTPRKLTKRTRSSRPAPRAQAERSAARAGGRDPRRSAAARAARSRAYAGPKQACETRNRIYNIVVISIILQSGQSPATLPHNA
jgi:hypothetical protein